MKSMAVDAVAVEQGAVFVRELGVSFEQAVLKLDVVDFLGRGFDLDHDCIVRRKLGKRAVQAAALGISQSFGEAHQGRRGVHLFEDFAIAQIHVDAARQARIETSHGAHDVDALEIIWAVFLEDRRVLHGVFVGSRCAVDVARVGVPRRGRIRMVIGDFSAANDHVMRKHSADRFVESAADRFVGNLERRKGLGPSGVQVSHRLLDEVECRSSGVGLEVSAGAIAFDSVAPFRNLPLELDFRFDRRFGQIIFTLWPVDLT